VREDAGSNVDVGLAFLANYAITARLGKQASNRRRLEGV
jgi:hypothetical protein